MTSGLPLETLASTITAHITAGDKAKDKSEQHYKAAGIHLMEAKERVALTKGLTWPAFLNTNCQLARSRADELIAIADGRTTLQELRASNTARKQKERAADPPRRHGKSSEIPQQSQQTTPEAAPWEAPEPAADDPRAVLLADLIRRISAASLQDLGRIDTTIRSLRDI